MAQTLDELKAENAEEETKLAAAPEAEAEETEEDAGEEEAEETGEAAESSEEEAEKPEPEAWQLEEDEQASSGDDARFTSGDVANAKKKLKARLAQRDDELAQLRTENESLRSGKVAQPAQRQVTAMPTLEAYDYKEPEYQAAMQEWTLAQIRAMNQSEQSSNKQTQAAATLATAVDGHYERAAKLTKEFGIEDQLYHDADLAVRQSIESVFPGHGDAITDSFISRLGIGSEKVLYSVGRNTAKREKLKACLLEDPSGISASVYLGELKGGVMTPVKRRTQAPKPAARAEGGSGGVAGAGKLHKQYAAETDIQTRMDLKRKSKLDGIDVSKW